MIERAQDTAPQGTDITACGRCATPISYAISWPWGTEGGRVCTGCVAVAAEQQQLQRAVG